MGPNNGIQFVAETPGISLNDITIIFTDDGSIADGSAEAEYDDFNPADITLVINIQNGVTTAQAVVDEIKFGVNSASIPFGAGNVGDSDGSGTIHTAPTTTFSETPATAIVLFLSIMLVVWVVLSLRALGGTSVILISLPVTLVTNALNAAVFGALLLNLVGVPMVPGFGLYYSAQLIGLTVVFVLFADVVVGADGESS